MDHPKLNVVTSDEFAVKLAFLSNARALHRRLQRSKEVEDIRKALSSGELTDDSIRRFVATLLRTLQPGQLFSHDLALAVIAVVLETRATAFAEEFLLELAGLEMAELPMAIRVARASAQNQSRIAGNKSKTVDMVADHEQLEDWLLRPTPHKVHVGDAGHVFHLEAS